MEARMKSIIQTEKEEQARTLDTLWEANSQYLSQVSKNEKMREEIDDLWRANSEILSWLSEMQNEED